MGVPRNSSTGIAGCCAQYRERPRCRNTTDKTDKFPSSHGRPLGRNAQEVKHSTSKGSG